MSETNGNPREATLPTVSSILGEGVGRRIVAVTGLFGAWLNQVSLELELAGGCILWPSQDLQIYGADNKYKANAENYELLHMHNLIMEECGLGWFTPHRPRFYSTPYPGPAEYIAQFPEDQDIVLTDNKFCFFIPLWQSYITDLVVVNIADAECNAVARQWNPAADNRQRSAVIDNYRQSLEGDVGLADKVWCIDNDKVKINDFTLSSGAAVKEDRPRSIES
jgi:hypothetical protein